MFRIVARNVCSNWLGFSVHALITFFLTPFVLDSLGGTQYGIWVLVTSFTGYYGLLTIGIGAGTTQQITRATAEGNIEHVSQLASTAFVALTLCGVAVALASVGVSLGLPYFFTVSTNSMVDARICVLIIGASTGFQFALFPASAVFTAKQRYDLSNLIGIFIRIISAVGTIMVLRFGGGLASLCLVIAAADSLGVAIRWKVARWLIPEMRISLRNADLKSLHRLASLSIWNTLATAGDNMVSTSGVLIIGSMLSELAIAPFAIALSLLQVLTRPLESAAIVFYPAAASLFARADMPRLRTVYLSGTKLMLLLGVAVGVPGYFWSADFYALWIPERLAEWVQFPPVSTVFLVLVVGEVVGAPMLLGHQIILGAHRIRLVVCLIWLEGLLSLTLGASAASQFGLLGIAAAAATAAIVVRAIVCPLVLNRLLGVSGLTYFRRVLLPPALVTMLLVPLLRSMRAIWGNIDSWSYFFLTAGIAGVSAMAICAIVGLTPQERDRVILKPGTRLLRYLGVYAECDVN